MQRTHVNTISLNTVRKFVLTAKEVNLLRNGKTGDNGLSWSDVPRRPMAPVSDYDAICAQETGLYGEDFDDVWG